MASSSKTKGSGVVGDYVIEKQIGSGSFSVVWKARHKTENTQVAAIKEIAMGRLNGKLQESLMSEISILKHISHPNIIRLLHIIQVPGKIYLVLEFCEGGDLSMYINRHGRVPEATAKHFMHQLAAGLKVLRDNNLIHRDLKPQNLLLSADDANSVLKIADFGFARSLQPRGLAETLCGSPLYMAPEIMQLQKYDAKADLWSVGAILFQLVTGKTPFTGSNQIQLLQNIMKSDKLHFPSDCGKLSPECKDLCQKLLRRNPVERLTFEEFFNHPFLSYSHVQSNQPSSGRSTRTLNSFPSSERRSGRDSEESFQEECLPFLLDDDSSGPDGSPSSPRRRSTVQTTYGFSIDSRENSRATAVNAAREADLTSRYSSSTNNPENAVLGSDRHGVPQNIDESQELLDRRSRVLDSMEWDQDYVFVPGPPLDMSSSSAAASKQSYLPHKAECPQASVSSKTTATAPLPITGAAASKTHYIGSFESQSSAPATSQGSTDIGDRMEQPSSNCMTRIRSLQECACAITEIVSEKLKAGKQLEAFSVQLVILAIWKQALHICHTQAASAMEGSPSQGTSRLRRSSRRIHSSPEAVECNAENTQVPDDISSLIEREFLREVESAEELAKSVEAGNTEIPDAMETIFQSALALGRLGGVDELMGNIETAVLLYSKAVRLLVFLLVEAPSLILNPPFSITNSDRYRLRTYIDILNKRQDYSRSQRMVLLKCGDQQSPS